MKISASFFCRAKNAFFASLLFVFAAGHGAETKNRTAVPMLPGENWWGLGSNFGREIEHQEAFLAAVRLRQKFAPKIVELAKRAAKDGEPIMRNLEYVFPGQGYAEVRDEFMMGDTLLVAPVLEKAVSSRSVLLPPGSWVADDGTRYDGPAKVEVSVDLRRLPYFMRGNQSMSHEEERK